MGMGQWLSVNGAAIYGAHPWHVCQNEPFHDDDANTENNLVLASTQEEKAMPSTTGRRRTTRMTKGTSDFANVYYTRSNGL